MRNSLLLLFLTALQLFGTNTYSQDTRLTLNMSDVSVQNVLKEIESKSEYSFLFNYQLVDVEREVDVRERNKPISDILTSLFDGFNVDFVVRDKQIVLSPKEYLAEEKSKMQPRTVTGQITDENGESLIGVAVVIKGSAVGTISDANGNYTLTNVPDNATLVVSYIGMLSQEVPVGNQTVINIIMEPDYLGLEEVVVVGYGTQKKVNMTGAVSIAGKEELEDRPVTNVQQALQGLVPNLVIASNMAGGEPGAEMNMNIRGLTTFEELSAQAGGYPSTGNAGPYVLVDGIPMNMNDVDPNDIESISVLKDAASTSIYGARAAYGVILITTKKGQQGVKVTYATNFGWQAPTIWPEMADGLSTVYAHNDAAINKGAAPYYDDDAIDRLLQNLADPGSAPGMLPTSDSLSWDIENTGMRGTANEDWRSLIFHDWAPKQKHNLSISGGNEIVNYYLSGGYFAEEGLLKPLVDDYSRYNLDAKINADATSWMDLSFLVKYKQGKEEYPWKYNFDRSYLMNWLNKIKPGTPSKYPGTDMWTHMSGIPAYSAENEVYTKEQLVISPRIILEPVEGWVTNIELNYRANNNHQTITREQHFSMSPDGTINSSPLEGTGYVSNMYTNDYMSPNIYSTYTRQLGRHNLTVLAGYQHEVYQYSNLLADATHLLSGEVPSIITAIGEKTIMDQIGHWATQSYFGRLNYNFDEKYLFEVNLRRDGSSRFEPDERWGTFPSVSAGWVVTKENFFPLKEAIDLLKIRASYGTLGNQNVANYLYLPLLDNYESYWLFGGKRIPTIWSPDISSINLTWEKVSTFDIGIDVQSLDNRLALTFDWYESRTTDLAGPGVILPAVFGTAMPKRNDGEITTRGWELEINWKNRVGDFSYGFKGVLSDYISRITKYNNPTNIISSEAGWGDWVLPDYYEGKIIGDIWGFETDGLYQSEEEITDLGLDHTFLYFGPFNPGDVKYVDRNDDGVINIGDNTLDNPGDRIVIGNNTPRYQFGINANASWKGFDISILLQGVGKRDLDVRTRGTFRGPADAAMHATCYIDHLDYWRDDTSPLGANPDAYFPRPYADYSGRNNKNYKYPTDRYLQNGAYIRLKNAQIGYTLPRKITQKAFISGARIYLSGENLLTFTKLMFFDPEAFSGRYYGPGDAYPLSRTVSVGLNMNF